MAIKIIVPVSGGKDSQACLKLALLEYDKSEIMGLFCDTQFEHPLTYAHINNMREMYSVEIQRITAGSVPEKVLKARTFPGGNKRHCTDQLKIIPSKIFYKELAEKQGCGFEVWYGMRSGESSDRKKRYEKVISNDLYDPNDIMKNYPKYLGKLGVKFRLPILDWSDTDVFDLIIGEHNPIYDSGFPRVGCFPCLASGDKWKKKAFLHDDFGRQQHVIVMGLASKIGESIYTSAGELRKQNPNHDDLFTGCSICQFT